MKIANEIKQIVIVATTLLFAAGCATTSHTAKKVYYFYPPPPDDPHIQFLTGFSSERDLRGGKEDKTLMTFLTGERPPSKDFAKPYGAAVANHKLYVCDTDAGAVLVVDLQTRRIGILAAQGEASLSMPLNIAIDADGNVYIADAGRNQVIIFDKSGNYIAALGKSGEMKPRDVAVDKNKIYVADFQTKSVRIFDRATHNFLSEIPGEQDRTNRLHCLFAPTNLALDSNGNIFVSDTGGFRVQVYDADGNFLRTIGEMGDSLGQFARIKGIALDHENRLYAADAMSQVVQIFDDKGHLLTYFGDPEANTASQNLPAKVLVDYDDADAFNDCVAPGFKVDYLVIVINQLGSHMVGVYGFGGKK